VFRVGWIRWSCGSAVSGGRFNSISQYIEPMRSSTYELCLCLLADENEHVTQWCVSR